MTTMYLEIASSGTIITVAIVLLLLAFIGYCNLTGPPDDETPMDEFARKFTSKDKKR